jgi:hypothetical protein
MMALALAHGPDEADKREAIGQYRALIADGAAEASDRTRLVSLLHGLRKFDEAKQLVLESVAVSPPGALGAVIELGNRLVTETGDRAFRLDLEAARKKRGDP